MKTQYVAEDGKIFVSEQDARDYENKILKKDDENKTKLLKKVEENNDKIDNLYSEIDKLEDKIVDLYKEIDKIQKESFDLFEEYKDKYASPEMKKMMKRVDELFGIKDLFS